jgi:hypothetical protein
VRKPCDRIVCDVDQVDLAIKPYNHEAVKHSKPMVGTTTNPFMAMSARGSRKVRWLGVPGA